MSTPEVLLIHVFRGRRIRFNLGGSIPMFPLGIAYLGAYLEKAGFRPKLVDMVLPGYQHSDIVKHVKKTDYLFIGLSATTLSLPEVISLVSDLRKATSAPLVLGGPATVFEPEAVFKFMPNLDAVAYGYTEGERVVGRLATVLASGMDMSETLGLAYRRDGEIFRTPPPEPLNLNEIPPPARHLLPHNRYSIHPPFNLYPPVALMETSRGCDYRCNFCALPRPARYRSAESVMAEVDELVKTYGTSEIHFIDPIFTGDRERVVKLCELILSRPYEVHWSFKTRADLVDLELLKLCRRAGCYSISYGIESGSRVTLDAMNKGYTVDDVYNALLWTKEAKIRSLAYILYAVPGETRRTIRETKKLLKKTSPDFVLFSGLYPEPKSEITRDIIRKNPKLEQELQEYFFLRKPLPGDKTPFGFPKNKVARWVLTSYLWYYLRPTYIFKRLFSLRNFLDLLNLFRGVFGVFKDLVVPKKTHPLT